jgi:hypothetical protein
MGSESVSSGRNSRAPSGYSPVLGLLRHGLGLRRDGAADLERMGGNMARYGKAAGKTVASAMRRRKRGTLKSGKGGKGGRVTSRKQAIAIGLSEARKKGAKVPRKKSS